MKALGIAGFVVSLVGLCMCGIPLGIVAIVLGSIAMSDKDGGKGFGIASFTIGVIDLVAAAVMLAFI